VPLLLDTTGPDVLADVLKSLKLRGRLFCRCELSAPWALGFPPGDFSHFHIIERGSCWLRLHGKRDMIALEEGDMLLVTQGHEYQLGDEPRTPPVPLEQVAGSSRGACMRYCVTAAAVISHRCSVARLSSKAHTRSRSSQYSLSGSG
jgi:hypothetical protein